MADSATTSTRREAFDGANELPHGHAPRALGRLAVAALGVNCVVGSGIFLLPGPVASRLASEAAPVAVPVAAGAPVVATVGAGILACLIALCFAEVASRFRETGGAYLYTREAFGELAGFEVGWLSALAGVVAWGALVNGFAVALGRLVPAVAEGPGHTVAIVGLLLVLAWLNLLGARTGGGLSTVASGVKLVTLAGFVAAGFALAGPGGLELAAPAGDGTGGRAGDGSASSQRPWPASTARPARPHRPTASRAPRQPIAAVSATMTPGARAQPT